VKVWSPSIKRTFLSALSVSKRKSGINLFETLTPRGYLTPLILFIIVLFHARLQQDSGFGSLATRQILWLRLVNFLSSTITNKLKEATGLSQCTKLKHIKDKNKRTIL